MSSPLSEPIASASEPIAPASEPIASASEPIMSASEPNINIEIAFGGWFLLKRFSFLHFHFSIHED